MRTGWVCPRCNVAHSPDAPRCGCPNEPDPAPVPAVGCTVLYKLSNFDIHAIIRSRVSGQISGSDVHVDDVFPMVIVKVWGDDPKRCWVNGRVLLDGNDTYWACSRSPGTAPGTFSFPVRA